MDKEDGIKEGIKKEEKEPKQKRKENEIKTEEGQ